MLKDLLRASKGLRPGSGFRVLALCSFSLLTYTVLPGCGGLIVEEEPTEQTDPPPAPPEEQPDEPEEPQEQLNSDPIANAGADRSALGGDIVMLDGSSSSDPDGDALSYSWQQIGGEPVSMLQADSAQASFEAPDVDDALMFELMVDDGRGGLSTDTVLVTLEAKPIPQLFIANLLGQNVTSYMDPAFVNGNIAPDTNLQGAQTQLNGPADIVVNEAGELLAANAGTPAITLYMDAEFSNGNLEPDANVEGAATQLIQPVTLASSKSQDLVFVADIGSDEIYMYEQTATSAFNGNVAPLRTIRTTSSGDLNDPFGINFGADDDLYVANRGGNNVLVFAGASNLNGDVTPSRIIESASFTDLFDVYVDGEDRMYVVCSAGGGNRILVFEDASSLNGTVAPDFELTVAGATLLTAIAVDSQGTGYVVDFGDQAVYAYDGIGALNGTLAPDRTIQGANTQLIGPIRVFLAE